MQPEVQTEGLAYMYDSLDGANWLDSENWGSTLPFSLWYGVDADNLGSVQSIDLSHNELSGSLDFMDNITSRFGSSLQTLNLGINCLEGTLPDSVEQLSSLTVLLVDRNSLTGTIPPALMELTSLVFLSLYGNSLTGTLPLNSGKLTSLQYFLLQYNSISGMIPGCFCNFTNLLYFSVSGNQMEGSILETIGDITGVQVLFLQENYFTSTIPQSIFQWDLTTLDVSVNFFTGVLPPTDGFFLRKRRGLLDGEDDYFIPHMSDLSFLNVARNSLTGGLPLSYGNLAVLQTLDISGNSFTGAIPAELCNIERLIIIMNNLQSICYPWCLFNAVEWSGKASNIATDVPQRCVGLQDIALCDFVDSTTVNATVSRYYYQSVQTYESDHPYFSSGTYTPATPFYNQNQNTVGIILGGNILGGSLGGGSLGGGSLGDPVDTGDLGSRQYLAYAEPNANAYEIQLNDWTDVVS
jgi:Leucine-rich repeat (LRR) protein